VTVSGDTTDSKIILEVESIDDTIKNSTLVTDKENRVWIINDTHGVQEYNSKTGKIKKLLQLPKLERDCIVIKYAFI
jgi:ligand-binding sensor domain-containing protein